MTNASTLEDAEKAPDANSKNTLKKSKVEARSTSQTPWFVKAISSDILEEQIEQEKLELSPEQKQHLHNHDKTDSDNLLNAELFRRLRIYRQLNITFNDLRANSKAFLIIRPDQQAIFSEGDDSNRLSGISLSTSADSALFVENFLVNARELFVQTYADMSEIRIQLYVLTEQSNVKGLVDLPPGASVTLSSRNDRSSVIGLSSFALDLE